MANVKYLETALASYKDYDFRNASTDGSMVISIRTILNALKKYEVGVPEEYFEKGGVCVGIEYWLCDEMKKGNIAYVSSNNTYDMVGDVSVDFGFAQFDSLVSDDTFVFMHIHNGHPFYGSSIQHNNYPAMLFKFKKGISFYDTLDDITLENINVPSMIIEVDGKHYLVLPRIICEGYFVKCLETGEELEPDDGICFGGDEEAVRMQIKSYLGIKRARYAKV